MQPIASPALLCLSIDEGDDDILYEDAEKMEEENTEYTDRVECVVFIAYNDGSIHVFSLPNFTEICYYSQIYVGNSVLQPSDGKNRGRGVFVRELMVAEVGVSEEPVMHDCVMTVSFNKVYD